MRENRVIILAILFLFLCFINVSCTSRLTHGYIAYEGKPVRVIGNDIINKIQAGKYDEIEDYMDYLIEKKPYSMDGTRILEDIFAHVSARLSFKGISLDDYCQCNC